MSDKMKIEGGNILSLSPPPGVVEAKQEVVVEEDAPVYDPEPTEVKVFKDRTPCNWDIKPVPAGIEAYNFVSRERFVGTMKDFNKILRG